MNREFFARAARLAACAVGVMLVAALGFGQFSKAHADTAASSGDCPYWINVATGKKVRTGPQGWDEFSGNEFISGVDRQTYIKQPDGTWINEATGKQVRTGPQGWDEFSGNEFISGVDRQTYYLVPCPPPPAVPFDSSSPPSGG